MDFMLEDVKVRELLQREAKLDSEDIVADWMLEPDGMIVNMMDIRQEAGVSYNHFMLVGAFLSTPNAMFTLARTVVSGSVIERSGSETTTSPGCGRSR
jgi:hypothetical protein